MATIEYYLTPVSPWVALAGTRMEEVAAKHGADIVYRPVDATQLFARTGGLPLGERHPNRQAYRLQELRRQSKKLGRTINIRPAHFPTNPAPASYAIIAAQDAGGGDLGALVAALGRACWEEERNIAEDEVIRDCLGQAGFDPALADRGLLAGAEAYGRNLEQAITAGVFGFPFYVVGEERFWGQDRIDDLDAHLAGDL